MNAAEISWVFAVSIKEGKEEALRQLVGEMSDQAEANEPDTLQYLWMISDDGTSGQVHERYRDSSAALTHLASFNQNFAERLMALVDPTGMVVFGNPSETLKAELAGVGPVFMRRAGGFARENG